LRSGKEQPTFQHIQY